MLPEFGFQIAPNQPSLGKMIMTFQLADMTSLSFCCSCCCCCCCRVSLVKFSYWSRSHVNTITCSGVITIFVN